MLYLTGSGLNPKTIPILAAHPMIGVLSTPYSLQPNYVRPFKNWAADNGCFTRGDAFSLSGYLAWLDKMKPLAASCLFATAPDVVADAQKTWDRSSPTFVEIRARGFGAALVAQNGIESMDIQWSLFDALFIGGDTEWKLSSASADVCREAKRRGMWVHMGRVNSLRRLEIAESFGCDSVDGNYLGFGPDTNLPKLLSWLDTLRRRPVLRWL
jgi:hypothetical protein